MGEVRRPHNGDEDLRRAHFTGQPVDDHRYGVAGVINEQFVATHVGLAHRNRELALPASVQLAEARVTVALRIALNVFVPEDRQRDVLALELAMDACPVRLDLTTDARARVNVNLELSRSGNGVRNGFRRPDGRGSGQFAESALDTLYVARNRG